MLAPIIFILALMLALASALLANGLAAAKIGLHSAVARYSDVALTDGVADVTNGLAAFVKQNGSSGPWPRTPSESFPKSLCDPDVPVAQCPFSYIVDGTITSASSDASDASTASAAHNVQTSVIAEGRLSVVVTAKLTAQDGTGMGNRTRLLTYRVFEAPPYAIVSGERDTDASNGSRAGVQGDTGGALPPDATSQSDTGSARDTRIHVQLTCSTVTVGDVPRTNDQQVSGNDGLPWGDHAGGAYETPCHRAASPADAFADKPWTNGNANSSGWIQ